MAVTALPRSRARAPLHSATLPPAILVLTLVAPALDLLALVQPGVLAPGFGVAAAGVAGLGLIGIWAQYPRTSWLAAASLVLRFVGTDYAPALSLLAVVALGLGGAFASAATPGVVDDGGALSRLEAPDAWTA